MLLLAATVCLQAAADYNVKSVSGEVLLLKHGKNIKVTTGMTLDPNDYLQIAEGSKVEILNTGDSKLYSIDTAGLERVARLIFQARRDAGSKSASVNSNLRIKRAKQPEGVVYVEMGKVTRSLAVYDPEAENMQMDADKLAAKLYTQLRDSLDAPSPAEALALTRRIEPDGLSFMVENTLDHPVYFNIFKISATDGSVTISELGQPVGCYAILPTQFLAREQTSGINPSELHIMLMSDYYFDIDQVLSKLNVLLDSKAEIEANDVNLYILPL